MSTLIERKKINPNQHMKSYPLICMEQFERLIMAYNVEFRGGFYIQANDPNGVSREVYVPDTREVFCNTCHALAIIIKPKFTKEIEEKYNSIMEELKELTLVFLDKSSVEETIVLGEAFYQKVGDKILLEEYNNKKVKIYTKLFDAISLEFHRHRYWSKSSVDD